MISVPSRLKKKNRVIFGCALLDLRCCVQTASSCGQRGYSLVCSDQDLLVAAPVVDHRLKGTGST